MLGSVSIVARYRSHTPVRIKQLTNTVDVETCGGRLILPTLRVGADGELADVVVELWPADDAPAELADLARIAPTSGGPSRARVVRCLHEPHVLIVPLGRGVELRNDDGILHEVLALGVRNPTVVARMPRYRHALDIAPESLARPERLKVTCETHPWMDGWWVVTDRAHVALTGADGVVLLEGVPPGRWRAAGWHPDLEEVEVEVRVVAGEVAAANLSFE